MILCKQKGGCSLRQWDIIVVGGGPSGLIAAVAAARNGARTLLIEKLGFLGGCAAMPMPILGFLSSEGERMVGGIPQRFVEELRNAGGATGDMPHPVLQSFTTTDSEILKAVADRYVASAGVTVLLHTSAIDVDMEEGEIRSVIGLSKEGIDRYPTKMVVDASGDGDLAFAAGARFQPNELPVQAATVQFTVANADLSATARYLQANPTESVYPLEKGRRPKLFMGFQGLVAEAREAGVMPTYPRDYLIFHQLMRRDVVGVNTTKISIDGVSSEDLTKAEVLGRRQAWEVVDCLTTYVPGFASAYLLSFADILGVRESRRVVGLSTLTREDVVSGRMPADTIARCCYPIDIHDPRSAGPHLEPIAHAYGIPIGCLIPEGIGNLLVAGRCLSATQDAMASARIMASCMAMGHAAGTAAAICTRVGSRPSELDAEVLRDQLRREGAIL